MNGIRATLLRELRAYFVSPLAYVVLFFMLLINGGVFAFIVSYLNQPSYTPVGSPLEYFFGQNLFFWIVLLFVCPVLTMRLLSEERRSGTLEVLMTAPISEGQVVAGKFLAALTFYLFLWLPTVSYAAILAYYGEVDWGPVAAGYLGILGVGSLMLAAGLFASALSRNQIIAAVIAFAACFGLLLFTFLDGLVLDSGWRAMIAHVNLAEHMSEFGRGVVDTRRLVYYLSGTLFFLFLTARTLESNKWR